MACGDTYEMLHGRPRSVCDCQCAIHGKTPPPERTQSERDAVYKAIEIVIKRHLGAFKELACY